MCIKETILCKLKWKIITIIKCFVINPIIMLVTSKNWKPYHNRFSVWDDKNNFRIIFNLFWKYSVCQNPVPH